MDEIEWDIVEVKRLKRKQLIQVDLVMLLVIVLSFYYIHAGWSISVFMGLLCLLMWVVVGHILYTLTTGKMIGTKTSKLVQAFDRDHRGEKRWKRSKVTDAVIISIVSALCTVLVFTIGFGSEPLEFLNLWPIIGAWMGFNIGEVIRTNNLK